MPVNVEVDCCGAEQVALPELLLHDHDQLWLVTDTLVAVPLVQRLRVGINAESTPLAEPQTPANCGDTELLAADAEPVPAELAAVTVNVYAVPLVKPVTVMGLEEPVLVMPPGLEVTV